MSWFTQYKEEQIFIQKEDEHNKFWAAYVDSPTHTAHIRWGRLGTKGQSQEKAFGSESAAARFVETKVSEKRRKGYHKVTKEEFEEQAIQAAIVGTANKCTKFQWIEIDSDDGFHRISLDRLQDPACNPGVYVEVETKKNYGGETSFRLVFTFDKTYALGASDNRLRSGDRVLRHEPLYELAEKVEEALGRSLVAA